MVSHVLRMYKAPGSNPGTSSTFCFSFNNLDILVSLMKNSFIRMINRNAEADIIKKANYFLHRSVIKLKRKNDLTFQNRNCLVDPSTVSAILIHCAVHLFLLRLHISLRLQSTGMPASAVTPDTSA